ncbi:HD domain-containing phosphohydrolase [Magnetospirillum molischianum]|uniref:Two-component response transcriptional regulator rpfG n=1 Tax=Magnetospirillum molischianum DSM 120 TaxID=1150626 RepID=H8FMY6_MAGML|nr:HD domain-containing phosphohydrolase [Magnetospirillum molischianum]CCG39724.1 Two-component response transcriptional regulator rpfG [Magnetospirillum molischianum DSM 120]
MLVHIVDDNDTNLMLFEQIVRRVDSEVSIACYPDPLAALVDCARQMADLVLVDYMMPGIDGHEYVRRMRAIPGARDVPIVMITAAADRFVRQTALELGVTDFLTKPVDPSEMRVRVTNLLALRRSHLRLRDQNRWLAEEVRNATRAMLDREEELIVRLAKAAEFRDPETGSHILRMAHYSRLIACGLGLADDLCELIFKAAPMHDVGKLGTPDHILLKPGRLDDNETEVMRHHPIIGHAILSGSSSHLIQLGAEIAITHHEKFDGTGYPYGIAGETIPISGRIVAVADVFDALTSRRPYKKAWEMERAKAFLIENSGHHFDPHCVEAFLAAWNEVLDIQTRFADPVELTSVAG